MNAQAPPNRLRHLLKTIYTFSIGFPLFMLMDLLVLVFSILTLFQARDRTMRWLVGPGAWLILRVMGIRVECVGRERLPEQPVVMIGNHLSSYDIFAVTALGLPRTRYFLSTYTYRVLPLTVIALCTRTIYIHGQEHPEKRIQCFQRAEQILRDSGDSVFLTPEGMRVTTGKVGHFNRGSFHLAVALQRPIVPFLIEIPPAINPGLGVVSSSGTVRITVQEPIDTSQWSLETLPEHIHEVRELYRGWLGEKD